MSIYENHLLIISYLPQVGRIKQNIAFSTPTPIFSPKTNNKIYLFPSFFYTNIRQSASLYFLFFSRKNCHTLIDLLGL
jgi:hypothetical protein